MTSSTIERNSPERWVVVTGASRGIGREVAEQAARLGYAVVLTYAEREHSAREVRAGIEHAGGVAVCQRCELSDEDSVMSLFTAVDALPGRLTGLVNNAAILDRQTRLEDMGAERIRRILEVNVLGAFVCAREAVRRMSTRFGGSGGSIVNVSSMAARLGSPNEYIDYAASKGALDTMTIGLSKETARDGIRVNGVRPGLIHTEMHASGGEPERVNRLSDTVPLGRGGQPEEVARAVLWLLGEEASYVTGSFIDVAGGR